MGRNSRASSVLGAQQKINEALDLLEQIEPKEYPDSLRETYVSAIEQLKGASLRTVELASAELNLLPQVAAGPRPRKTRDHQG